MNEKRESFPKTRQDCFYTVRVVMEHPEWQRIQHTAIHVGTGSIGKPDDAS